MAKRDPQRLERIRTTVRLLKARGVELHKTRGARTLNAAQSRLAEHFGVSKQRIHQIVREVEAE